MGCHELVCEWAGKRLRVVTRGGLRTRRQLWIDTELADEVSSTPLPLRYPLLCARIEADGEFHDVDVVHERTPTMGSAPPVVKVLVNGEVIHGDPYARPRVLIEPRIWGRLRSRGVLAYVVAESPRGVLWLAPAILVLLLQSLELYSTIALVSLLAVLAFVVLPVCFWLVNERRWRSRTHLLERAQTRVASRKPDLGAPAVEPLSRAV